MLTGDNARTAAAIQKQLEISRVVAEVLPQEKEQEIRRLQAEGRPGSDDWGWNQRCSGAGPRQRGHCHWRRGQMSPIESADVVLMKNDLLDGVTALQLGRAVIRNIKENLFWAFFYNAIGIPLGSRSVLYPAGMEAQPDVCRRGDEPELCLCGYQRP